MVRYKVTVTAEERQQLEKLVSSGKGAARKLAHARILLLADESDHGPGRTNAAIVAALAWTRLHGDNAASNCGKLMLERFCG